MDSAVVSWGDETAQLIFRASWKGVRSPWRHLARLNAGDSWFSLPEPDPSAQSQIYVVQPSGDPIPPEAMAAKELIAIGADEAFVIENWLGIGVMDHQLIGTSRDHRIWTLIEDYKRLSRKSGGGGFPDVVGFWPNQKVSFCEVKIRGEDRLNRNQIEAVRHLRTLLGHRLDLRIFEWPGLKCSPHAP